MSSKFERDMQRDMRKNVQGQESEKPIACPYCQQDMKLPMEQVMFGGAVTCPHCGDSFQLNSSAADDVTSTLSDFKKNLARDMKRNRGKR